MKSPFWAVIGEMVANERRAAPVPCAATVTLAGSPPKEWMFSWTQTRAAMMSRRPKLLNPPPGKKDTKCVKMLNGEGNCLPTLGTIASIFIFMTRSDVHDKL